MLLLGYDITKQFYFSSVPISISYLQQILIDGQNIPVQPTFICSVKVVDIFCRILNIYIVRV